jgi:Holliday junction resolvase RusA-like endonuclease
VNGLHFVIPGRPVSWKRVEGGVGKRFVSPEQRKHKHAISYAALGDAQRQRMAGHPWPKDVRYTVMIDFYLPTAHRVDVDNLSKIVLDALNGIAWDDDSQVKRIEAEKHTDKADPRTEVSIYVHGQEEAAA